MIAVLSFVGCEELDFSNPNSPDLTSASIQALVTGAEAGMRTDLDVYIQVTITIGREGYFFEPADPRFTGELLFGPVDPGGFLTLRPWQSRYQVVFNTNELLKRAEELSGTEKAAVEGYAKTIRAYQLLLNLNYLDDSGIRLNFDGDISKPFATKEQAFDFIENDLDEAFTALNSAGSSFPFSLSSGFAGFDTPSTFAQFNRAIAARVKVYRGVDNPSKFNEALTALQASFLNPGGDLTRGVYHVYSTALGDLLNPVFEVPTAPGLKLHAHQSFETDAQVNAAGVTDLRFTTKTFKRPIPDVFDELSSDLAITITSSSTDGYPIIRNEELILLRAEANIGLGNFGAAEADMNIVRTAAGLDPYTGTDATNALDRLLYEKRYSLFGEGHRWIDMRRYGKLNELPIDRPNRGDMVIPKMAVPETEVPG
jgi:hypothetical protein